jgi:hypothetical protein
MLQAIINGKAGRLPAEVKPGASWRHVFRTSEDLLTASVFERLAYLDGALIWEILRQTFRPALLPARRIVELEEIKFWPAWPDLEGTIGQDVEPDVVLRLSVGDPPRRVALVVECKTGNGRQYAGQWSKEWRAFEAQSALSDPPDEVWLLALGGLPESATATVTRFTEEIREKWGVEVRALAADWTDLSRTLDEVELGGGIAERVVEDIRAALELDGYRTIRPMSELANCSARHRMSPASAGALRVSQGLGSGNYAPEVKPEQLSAMSELGAWAARLRTNSASASVLSDLETRRSRRAARPGSAD